MSKCQGRRFQIQREIFVKVHAYPSNGSFNPFLISNKEAHIVNGNTNRETVKVLDDKEHAISDSTDSICAREGVLAPEPPQRGQM